MQIAGNVPATREKLRNKIERSMMGPSLKHDRDPYFSICCT
jgi:hypothetical protein